MDRRKNLIKRWIIYCVGMVVLAMGLVLNTKSGLGSSPIVSVAYTVSEATGISFGNTTLAQYALLILLEFLIKGKNRNWLDLLQFPLALIFTRFMDLFKVLVTYKSGFLPTDLIILLLGITCTGVGAATSVDMCLIPNPGDGFVQAISMKIGKELGICKNYVDITCVAISLMIGLCLGNVLMGVSLGTVIAMVLVGRVISIYNRLMRTRLEMAAGLAKE